MNTTSKRHTDDDGVQRTTAKVRLMEARPMRRTRIGTIVATMMVLGALTSGQGKPAEIELAAAKRTEKVEGDEATAIKLYTLIAEKYKTSDRENAAQSLLCLAQLHERRKNPDAQRVYARIVSEFADQLAAVADAKTRLAALWPSGAPAALASANARALRLVYSGSFTGQVSPDGRYLAHDDWPVVNKLNVRDLTTNRVSSHEHSGFEWGFSRDSGQLAYGRCENRDHCEVRVLRIAANDTPRTVFKTDAGYAGVIDWSPDGQTIAIFVTRRADRVLQFGLLQVATGAFRALKTVEWGGAVSGVFSPDGRDIAIDSRNADQGGKRDIVLMAVDASREVPLVTGPADEFVLDWTPDGKHLLYASDSNGPIGVWALPVVDRRPQGPAKQIAASVGTDVKRVGLTRAGALHLGVRSNSSTAEVVTVDLTSGKRTGTPSRPIRTIANTITAPSWSPDGKSLLYHLRRNGELLVGTVSLETGVEREVRVSSSLALINSYVSWAPDGSFVTYGRDLKGRYGVFRIDSGDGQVTPLVFRGPDGRAGVEGFFWSTGGTKMYYRSARRRGRTYRRARRGLGLRARHRCGPISIDEPVA